MLLQLYSVREKSVFLTAVGFEPPPEGLVPKTSALDHSATLPLPQTAGKPSELAKHAAQHCSFWLRTDILDGPL
jgi:hypothetical protein